jgi:hypothetical protein
LFILIKFILLVSGTFANGELLKRTYDSSGNPTGTALAKYTLDAAGTIKSINTIINSTAIVYPQQRR